MQKKVWLWIIAIMLIAFAGCTVKQTGESLPDFTLTDLSGETVTLSSLKGKKVFLNFWATWCPPCKAEMPHMEEIYKEYKEQNLEIIAVNIRENQDKVNEFMNENGLTFPVLLDLDGKVSDQYNIASIPTSYFINSDGVLSDMVKGGLSLEQMKQYIDKLE